MYAHPAFVRGQPETLSLLRKSNSVSTRKRLAAAAGPENTTMATTKITIPAHINVVGLSRTVSPSPPRMADAGYSLIAPIMPAAVRAAAAPASVFMPTPSFWHHHHNFPPPPPTRAAAATAPVVVAQANNPTPVSPGASDSRRLDLLAMALTSMAERDATFGANATAVHTA